MQFNDVEAGTLDRRPRVAVRMAAVPHPPPEGSYGGLKAAKKCPRSGGDVFNKNEFATGLQHTQHLGDCAALIHNATQNKSANGVINRGRLERQFLRRCLQNFNLHSQTIGFFRQVLIHVGVRFYAYPPDTLRRQMSEVRSGTWTNFQYRSRDHGKQLGLVRRKITVGLVAESRHKPGKYALPDGTGAAADVLGVVFGAFSTQSIDYNAITGRPP